MTLGFTPVVLWSLSILLLYLSVSVFRNGISYIAFRGNMGPIRDTEAIGMGTLMIVMAMGFFLWGLFGLING